MSIFTEIQEIIEQHIAMTRYGKSTDVKPTTGVSVGTIYHEVDTGSEFQFDGTSWVAHIAV